MKRRSFVKTSVMGTATALTAALKTSAANPPKQQQEYYELRIYTLKDAVQQKLVEDYYQNAAIPALNRLGVKNVGVFTELKPAGQTRLFVIACYKNIEHFAAVNAGLDNDAAYQQQAAAYLQAPAAAPAYERIESSLLKAFAHMPHMQAPAATPRIFELRQYQSASEAAGKKKIEMFNDEGEIDIFKRLGFKPVFFGETVIGGDRPNLTYMVTFDDMAAHDAHWKSFGSDPEWKKISTVPGYADALLVSKITPTFLVPVSYSQV
ncbi:MAG TPA: NIPSNAP family protein [Chitinophagaceae bacterium]|jgi:hypothetical protein|nr:NIPSNAP family protein [Chitinophagaceae bacterium]